MSADQAEMIDGIREKVVAVKSRYKEQAEAYAALEAKHVELQQLVSQKQSQIEELEEKNQKLALVQGIMADSEDASEARIRINKIVREIDKCIALLNR